MKIIATLFILFGATFQIFCQVDQMIYLKNNQWSKVEYVSQTKDSLIVIQEKKKELIHLSKDEIKLIQTLGVYFKEDNYDNFLSGGNKALNYTKLGSNTNFDIEISGRIINNEIAIVTRFIFGDFVEDGIYIFQGDVLFIALESGDIIELALSDGHFNSVKDLQYGIMVSSNMRKEITYNLSYAIIDNNSYKKIVGSPIKSINLNDDKVRVDDKYCIMRHLLALKDENINSN
jgi:hypothetical protein